MGILGWGDLLTGRESISTRIVNIDQELKFLHHENHTKKMKKINREILIEIEQEILKSKTEKSLKKLELQKQKSFGRENSVKQRRFSQRKTSRDKGSRKGSMDSRKGSEKKEKQVKKTKKVKRFSKKKKIVSKKSPFLSNNKSVQSFNKEKLIPRPKQQESQEQSTTRKINEYMSKKGLSINSRQDLLLLMEESMTPKQRKNSYYSKRKSKKPNSIQRESWNSRRNSRKSSRRASSRDRFGSVIDYDTTEGDIFRRNADSIKEYKKVSRANSAKRSSRRSSQDPREAAPTNRRLSRKKSLTREDRCHFSRHATKKNLIPMRRKKSAFKEYRKSIDSSFTSKPQQSVKSEEPTRNANTKFTELASYYNQPRFSDPRSKISLEEDPVMMPKNNIESGAKDRDLSEEPKELKKPVEERFSIPLDENTDLDLRDQLREILGRSEGLNEEDKIRQTEQLIAKMLTSGRYNNYRQQLTRQATETQSNIRNTTDSGRISRPRDILYSNTVKNYDESFFVNNEVELGNNENAFISQEKSGMSPEISRNSNTGKYREILFSNNQMSSSNNTQSMTGLRKQTLSRKVSHNVILDNSKNIVNEQGRSEAGRILNTDVFVNKMTLTEQLYTNEKKAETDKDFASVKDDVLVTDLSQAEFEDNEMPPNWNSPPPLTRKSWKLQLVNQDEVLPDTIPKDKSADDKVLADEQIENKIRQSEKLLQDQTHNYDEEIANLIESHTVKTPESSFIGSSKLVELKKKLFKASPAKVKKVEALLSRMGNNDMVKYLCRKDFAFNGEDKFKLLIQNKPDMVDPFEQLELMSKKKQERCQTHERDFKIDYNIYNLVDEKVTELVQVHKQPKAQRDEQLEFKKHFAEKKKVEAKEDEHLKSLDIVSSSKPRSKPTPKITPKITTTKTQGCPPYKDNHEKCHTFYCKNSGGCCHKEFDKTRFGNKEEAKEFRRKRKQELLRQMEEVKNRNVKKEKKVFMESKPMKSFLNSIKNMNKNNSFYNLISRRSSNAFKRPGEPAREAPADERPHPFAINITKDKKEDPKIKGLGSQSIVEMINQFENPGKDLELGKANEDSGLEREKAPEVNLGNNDYSKMHRKAGLTSNPLKNLVFMKKPKFATHKEGEEGEGLGRKQSQSLTPEDIVRVKKRQSKKIKEVFGTNSKRAKTHSTKSRKRPKNLSVKREKKRSIFPDLMTTFGEQRDSLPQNEEHKRKTVMKLRLVEQEKIREIARKFREVAIGDGETDDESFEEIEEETEQSMTEGLSESSQADKVERVESKANEVLGFNEYSTKKPSNGKEMGNSFQISNEPNSIAINEEALKASVQSQGSENKPRVSVFRKEKNSIGDVFQRGRSFQIEPDSAMAISKRGAKAFYDKEKQEKERNVKSKSVSDKNVLRLKGMGRDLGPTKNIISVRENTDRFRAKTDNAGQIFTMKSGDSFGENNTVVLNKSESRQIEVSIPVDSDNSLLGLDMQRSGRDKAPTVSVLEMSLSEVESRANGELVPSLNRLMSPDNTFQKHFEMGGFRTKDGLISKIEEDPDEEIEHFINVETFDGPETPDTPETPETAFNGKDKFMLDSKKNLDMKNMTFHLDGDNLKNDQAVQNGKGLGRQLSGDTNQIIEDAEQAGGIEGELNKDFLKNVNDAITDQILFSSGNTGITGDLSPIKKTSVEDLPSLNLDEGKRTTTKQFTSYQSPASITSLGNRAKSNQDSQNQIFKNNLQELSLISGSRQISVGDLGGGGRMSNVKPYALLSDISKAGPARGSDERNKVGFPSNKSRASRSTSQEKRRKKKKSIVESEYIEFDDRKSEYQSEVKLNSLDGYFNDLGGTVVEPEGKTIRKEIQMVKKMVNLKKLRENLFKKKESSGKGKKEVEIGLGGIGSRNSEKAEGRRHTSIRDDALANQTNPIGDRVSKQTLFNVTPVTTTTKAQERKEERRRIGEEAENLEVKRQRLEERLKELKQQGENQKVNKEIEELLMKLSQLERNKKNSGLLMSDLETDIKRISDVYEDNYFLMMDRKSRNTNVPRLKRQSTTKNKAVMKDFYKMEVTEKVSSKQKTEESGNPGRRRVKSENAKTIEKKIDIYATNEEPGENKDKFSKYRTEPIKEKVGEEGSANTRKRPARLTSLWKEPRKRPNRKRKQRMESFMKLSCKGSSKKNSLKSSKLSVGNSALSDKRASLLQRSREVLDQHNGYFQMGSGNTSIRKSGGLSLSQSKDKILTFTAKDEQSDTISDFSFPGDSANNFLKNASANPLPDLLEMSEDQEIFTERNIAENLNTNTRTLMSDADYFNMSGPSKASKSINSRRKGADDSVFGFSQKTEIPEVRNKADTMMTDSYFDI